MSDYVISRKRSRPSALHAVDPCLGYYVPQDALQHDSKHHAQQISAAHSNAFSCDDWRTCVIPSSCPEEIELDHPSGEVGLGDQEEDDMSAVEWTELVSSRSKRTSCPTVSDCPLSAAPPYHKTNIVHSDSPQTLTVEGFLKEATRLKPNSRKIYHSKFSAKKPLKAKDIRGAAHVSPKIRALHEHEDGHEADNILELRSREVPRVLLSEDSQASHVESASSGHGSPSASSFSKSPRIKRKRRKYRKSLKERIYEAVVATHGLPDDEFAQDEIDPTRIPLRFVPGPNHAGTPSAKKKSWNLVDPRKSRAIRTASFSSRLQRPSTVASHDFSSAGLSHSLDRLPMEGWVWSTDISPGTRSSLLGTKPPSNTSKRKRPEATERESDYPPLTLLPIDQTCSDYANLFRGKRAWVDKAVTKPKHVKEKRPESSLRELRLDVPLSNRPKAPVTVSVCTADRNQGSTTLAPALKLVPSTLKTALGDSQRHSSVSPRKEIQYPYTESSQQLSFHICTPSRKLPTAQESPVMTSPISLNALSPIALSTIEAFTSPVQLYQLSDEHRQPSTVLSPPFSQLGFAVGGPEDDTRLSTPASIPSTRRLRTLGSFMDEFFETIRSVNVQTPAEATQAGKYSRQSKTMRRSSQTRAACIDNNNDSEGTSPILRGRRLPVTQPSQLPSEAETRPSNSPDIFALLEQDNYRITLVST